MPRLGTVTATAMVPGVSSNRRLYTREAIAKAAARMDGQIKAGGLPILMRSHHGAGDDSTRIVGAWRGVSVDPTSGAMKVHGDLADTSAGRDIAALTTPDDSGQRFLDSVSIYGYWVGDPQTVDHMGQQVETCDDLEIAAVDFTGSPGVAGARIESVRIGESRAAGLIAESKELAVTADTSWYDKGGVLPNVEAKGANTDAPAGSFADPGYQSDGKKRYPLDSKAHIRAAWAFINQAANAKPYTAAQVKRIKARIKTAAKKAGVTISAESAAADFQTISETLLPRIAEAYASMNIDNGQGDIRVSGYVSDPTDLPDLAAATSRATLAALAALDPDEDGDIDLGPDADDTSGEDDNDMDGTCQFCGSDVPAGASFCPGCGQPITSGESTAGQSKETAVTTTTTTTEASATAPSTETAPTGAEATSPATDTTAATTSAATEAAPSGLDVSALGKAIGEAVAAALTTSQTSTTSETGTTSETSTAAQSEATTSTPTLAEALKVMKDELREEIVAAVGPRRRGLVRTEAAVSKPLHEMTDEEFRAHRTDILNAVVPGGPQG